MKSIVLAGGCFWGVEEYYKRLKGIESTRVGYAQGSVTDPNYRDVCSGTTNHAEVCEVIYDEFIITLEKVLEHLFRIIDPTSLNRQGGDRGTQYRTGVYYTDTNDLEIIQNFINKQQASYNKPIVVEIEQLKEFYDAEDYHQDYLTNNPTGYCHVNMSLIKEDEKKDQYKK